MEYGVHGGEHGVIVAQAIEDYVGFGDQGGDGVRDRGMTDLRGKSLSTRGGTVVDYQGLCEVAFFDEVFAHALVVLVGDVGAREDLVLCPCCLGLTMRVEVPLCQ